MLVPFGEERSSSGASSLTACLVASARQVCSGRSAPAPAHVLTTSGTSAGDALGLAAVGFGTRIPIALALGWLFLRRGTIWASFGLHAAFNGILLVLAEVASRSL